MPRSRRPIVPEEHLGPVDHRTLKRMRRLAHCDDSPTKAHHFYLTKQDDGADDGPCLYCHKLYSKVYKKSKIKGGTRRMTNKKEANQITVRDLTEKTGVDARIIRRLLRKQFGGGAKKVYAWGKGDPKVNEVIKAIKDLGKKGETKKAGTATKKSAKAEKKAGTKGTKKAQKTGGKKATEKTPKAEKKAAKATGEGKGQDMSIKRQKVAKKVSDETIKKTGKAPTQEQIDAAMENES